MEKWIGLLCPNVSFIENNIAIYCSVQFHTTIYMLYIIIIIIIIYIIVA